jgi:hypothetical protein
MLQQEQQQQYGFTDQAVPGQQQQQSGQSLQQQPQQDQPPPPQLLLCGLELVLGPELRAVFPVVLNVGVSGRVTLHGDPAAPAGLRPAGRIRLEGGVLNLVATQFRLEREHPNTISFSPDAGLDPLVDVALSSSELRAVINGRASAWQEHLSLTAVGPAGAAAASVGGGPGGVVGGAGGGGAAGGGGGGSVGREGGLAGLVDGDLLGGRAVARVFEGRLAEALLAEDGSLSLATLAGNTLGSLLPKIETQGQLGKARWGDTHSDSGACIADVLHCVLCVFWHPLMVTDGTSSCTANGSMATYLRACNEPNSTTLLSWHLTSHACPTRLPCWLQVAPGQCTLTAWPAEQCRPTGLASSSSRWQRPCLTLGRGPPSAAQPGAGH